MRSAASPRAVSISTGVSDFVRSSRHTSSPSMSGSIRSSTSASKGSLSARSRRARAPEATETRKPGSPRYSDTISASRASSSIRRMRSAMPPELYAPADALASSAVAPASAEPLHALGDLLALSGSQHLRDVGERLREALRRLLGELELLRAQRLDRAAVDRVRGEEIHRLLACGARLVAQRQAILDRLLHDRLELLLLLLGRVDLDVEVL